MLYAIYYILYNICYILHIYYDYAWERLSLGIKRNYLLITDLFSSVNDDVQQYSIYVTCIKNNVVFSRHLGF